VFLTYFEENKVLHCHDTRQKNDFHMYAVQSEAGKRLLVIRALNYGIICLTILNITSPLRVKYRLKCYMLQSLE